MTPRKNDESLSGAYVLHAVDADEAERFEASMAESEQTRNEVTELTDTAVLLGLAVEPVTPPASLKASIMAQLATTPQLPRVEETPVDAPVFVTAAERKAQARWFTRPVTALVAAAAAVALIVGGGVAATSINNNLQYQAQVDQLAAINAASDSQRVESAIEGGGTATLVWSNKLASSVMTVDGLAALPSDRVYELWYIDEDGARPAGTFSVGDSGSTWRVLDGTMGAGDTVGLTVEPAGGSLEPTTTPIVAIASA